MLLNFSCICIKCLNLTDVACLPEGRGVRCPMTDVGIGSSVILSIAKHLSIYDWKQEPEV